ncbi:N-acetylneuraminate synthase [bacterium]|nr:N-acetylneuraminate synthase [bacterium]
MKKNVFVIAEAGVNHNGSVQMALELVDAAADAQADAVKFQTFQANKLVVRKAPKSNYQLATTDSAESQFEMLKKLELSNEAHHKIQAHCNSRKIEFMSTPFDHDGIDFLVDEMKVSRLKLPSGEITNAPYLLKAARTGKPIILSTGMSHLAEVEEALAILAFGYFNATDQPTAEKIRSTWKSDQAVALLRKNVTLLQCTTEYPAAFSDVNLRAMETLRQEFKVNVGISDHTPGINIPIAATALGAIVVEKHFTLDRKLPGPDHQASLEPAELKAMIQGIRQVEAALGNGVKAPAATEVKNLEVVRKSLVALKPVKRGEIFTEENLGVKRPGTGISPIRFWEYLGQRVTRDFDADQLIEE